MGQYTITEKQNAQSRRDGTQVEAASLSDAKRRASRMQVFHGTVIEISDAHGVLSVKRGGKWQDQ